MTTSRARLVAAHETAAGFYRRLLESPAGAGPRGYLCFRGLEQSLDDPRWTIGYAPPGWTALLTELHAHGFTDTEILDAGLATVARTGHLIDRFRDRLMLGIRTPNGELVGFTGRAAPNARRDVPRYLNSPATMIFTKSELLVGLAEQTDRFRAGAKPVIVEGSLDVLAVAGSTTEFAAVATCGTSLRAAQVDALAGSTRSDTVLIGYDGDDAGRKASRTAYPLLAGAFAHLTAARFADGEDPASLARSDPARLRTALAAARPLADVLIDECIGRHPEHRTNTDVRINALHEATRTIAGLRPSDIPGQVARTAEQLGLHHSIVSDDLAAVVHEGRTSSTGPRSRPQPPGQRRELPRLGLSR